MVCPNCSGNGIRHAESVPIHFFRMLTGSHKYYCPNCGQKWRARQRSRKNKVMLFMPVLFVLSFATLHMVEGMLNKWRETQIGSGLNATFEILKDKKLMEKISSSGGNPYEAIKSMSASERQKIQKYVASTGASNTDDLESKLKSMGISVDSATLARIAKFKSNPKSALSEITPEEKKRAKSELAKANVDVNSLKSQAS